MEEGTNLFSVSSESRTRHEGYKLQERRFQLDIRKKFWMVRSVLQWNRLLWEVVDSPSLETFKQRLNRHLLEML